MSFDNYPIAQNSGKASIVEHLRRVSSDAWVEITEPNGWQSYINIGVLLHAAADEIERLQALVDKSGEGDRDEENC